MKLIDFQMCRFASLGVDLTIFLVTSAQEEVKLHRLPELYSTYLDSFNSTSKIIGSEEKLTLEDFQDELKLVEVIHFGLFSDYVAMILCENDNVLNLNQVITNFKTSEEINGTRKLLNGKHYKKVAKYTLNKLEEQGFLISICVYLNNFNLYVASTELLLIF